MLPLPELDEEPELAERLGSVPPPVLSEIPGPPRDDDIASLCIHTPLSRYVFVPGTPIATGPLTTTPLSNRESESSTAEVRAPDPNLQGFDRPPDLSVGTESSGASGPLRRNPSPVAIYGAAGVQPLLALAVNHNPPRIPRRIVELPELDSNQQPSG